MKRGCRTLFIFVSFLLIIGTVNAWSVELDVLYGNTNETLVFGFNENASDKFDKEYDLPYPPPLPQQPFYASFIEPDEIKYYKKNYKSKNLSWNLYIKADRDIKIEWNSIPANLNIIININNESINMNEKSSILLEAGEHILSIKVIKVMNQSTTQTPKPKSKEISTPTDSILITPGFEAILVLIGGSLALFLRNFKK